MKVIKRDESVASFDLDKIATGIMNAAYSTGGFKQDMKFFLPSKAREIFGPYDYLEEPQIAESLALQTAAYLRGIIARKPEKIVEVEQIQDGVEHILKSQGFIDIWECYRLYRWGRTAIREGHISEEKFSRSGLPDRKCREIKRWNELHGCDTLCRLDKIVNSPDAFAELVEASTQVYEEDLDMAISRYEESPQRVMVVAGPSSSGKTTTTRKLVQKLQERGYPCKGWELDNYYLGLKHVQKDEFDDYNYETPEALDIKLIRQHLYELLEGKLINVPKYDFKKGKRNGISSKTKLQKGEILIIDSLYSFSPVVFPPSLSNTFYKVYIETLNMVKDSRGRQVKLTDNRLLRRMSRDSLPIDQGGRGYPLDLTLGLWHYVRKVELRSLIPFMHTADLIINGGLAFELPVLRGRLHRKLPKMERFYEQGRLDAFIRGTRIKRLFNEVNSGSQRYVPEDSLLREFIGRKGD